MYHSDGVTLCQQGVITANNNTQRTASTRICRAGKYTAFVSEVELLSTNTSTLTQLISCFEQKAGYSIDFPLTASLYTNTCCAVVLSTGIARLQGGLRNALHTSLQFWHHRCH